MKTTSFFDRISTSRFARIGILAGMVGLLTALSACATHSSPPIPTTQVPRIVERDLSGMTERAAPRPMP